MKTRKIIGLASIITGVVLAASMVLTFTGNDFLASLFGFYGDNPPADKAELCQFLKDRLADPNLKSPRFIHRYQTDLDTQCKPDLRTSAPEVTHASLGYFLHEASSGAQVFARSNNYIQTILDLYYAKNPTADTATHPASPATTTTTTQKTGDATTDGSTAAEHPKVKVRAVQTPQSV